MARGKRNNPPQSTGSSEQSIDIAIIGGGIAGLFCAWKLDDKSKSVRIYEASDELGGRISTERYPNVSGDKQPEFIAEFGPMRIEPDQQPLLRELLEEDLGIKETEAENKGELPRLVDFPPYSSPPEEFEPNYPLEGEENEQKTPLDLMKLAFVRILGRLVVKDEEPCGTTQHNNKNAEKLSLRDRLKQVLTALTLAAASRQPGWQGAFDGWIKDLGEADYQNIREYAEIEYEKDNRVPLWNMGFWNLLSDVLSHNAVLRLRDMGTFYHLISENPNAAEWMIFWFRALKSSDKLKGIDQGMDSITALMEKQIEEMRIHCEIKPKHKLIRLELNEDSRIRLKFEGSKEVIAEHVILALPKRPLSKVVSASINHFPDHIIEHLDAVFGFPMVKIFFIVKQRWWEEEYRANTYATQVPTRELHYWKSKSFKSKKGMIMVYTDRPGSSFWANYLATVGVQDAPDWGPVSLKTNLQDITELSRDNQTKRLILKLIQYIKAGGVESIRESDIVFCGIRDWGREPYAGANHTWRPERKSWEVLAEISAFSLTGGSKRNVHICGEAYSDYHGFIEGSLRSAAHVLHRISPNQPTETPWLCLGENCNCDSQDRRQRFPSG